MKKLILTLGSVLLMVSSVSASSGLQTIEAEELQSKLNNHDLYYWEVESDYGKATGFAKSLEEAEKMVALVGEKDVITYKKIISK